MVHKTKKQQLKTLVQSPNKLKILCKAAATMVYNIVKAKLRD